ncbi:MAG: hypothetical protein GXO23_07235 [Crenarchaeota archaeon]|nr:hypothetical protein [Thermoproteota archaeon]
MGIVERISRIADRVVGCIEVCPDERSLELYKNVLGAILISPFLVSVFEFFSVSSPVVYSASLLAIYVALFVALIYFRSRVCGYLSAEGLVVKGRKIDLSSVRLIVINTRECIVEIFGERERMVLRMTSLIDRESRVVRRIVTGLERRGIPVAVI